MTSTGGDHKGSETNFNTGYAPDEEAYTERAVSDELRLADGIDIEANGNPILEAMAALARSEDLINTQKTIVVYETGDVSLYRSLHRMLNIGELIMRSDAETLKVAFCYLSEATSSEGGSLTHNNGSRYNGFRNIGMASVPAADQRFFKRIKDDALFVYKTLINFYFPNVSAAMRGRYYTVINWAHANDQPNFVQWISGEHEVDIGGEKVKKRGLKGAYLKIRGGQIASEENDGIKSDGEIEKVFENTNKVITIVAPSWLDECVQDVDEPFMILGRMVGDELRLVNCTTSNSSYIKASIKEMQGALFPSDLDYTRGNPVAKMVDAIKNLIQFSAAPELIMWQDTKGGTYLMPLYDEWIEGGDQNTKFTDRKAHVAVIVDLFNVIVANGIVDDNLLFRDAVEADFDNDVDVTKFGYITSQIDKVRAFKGSAYKSFRWVNDDQTALEFMGAQWFLATNRRPKKQTQNDIQLGRTRLPTITPYGHKYLLACKFADGGRSKYGEMLTEDIDFSLARAVYKRWAEVRKENGVDEYPDYVTICVRNGVIGIWFEDIIVDDITYYDNRNEIVKIGTFPHTPTMKGQWRIQTIQLRKVWNLLTGPWEMYSPYSMESVQYFKEPPFELMDAIKVMESEPDLPFGSMQDLCSTKDEDFGCKYDIHVSNGSDGDHFVETRRKCIPFILRSGALWLYLFNETK